MKHQNNNTWMIEQFKEGHTTYLAVNAFGGNFIVKIKNKSLRPSDITVIDKTNGYPNPNMEAIQKKNMFDRMARELLAFLNIPLNTKMAFNDDGSLKNPKDGVEEGVNMPNRAKSEKVGMEGK